MRGRKILEWLVTAALGVVVLALLLNQTLVPSLALPGKALLIGSTPTVRSANTAKSVSTPPMHATDTQAQALLAQLSLDQKLGQLIMPISNDRSLNAAMQTLIDRDQIGGYFIDSGNMTADQLRAFTAQLQSRSKVPLILATDFEGGPWNPIAAAVGQRPSPASIAARGDVNQARQKGIDDARLLTSVGLNVNFAPVVDVLTNPNNPILQGRTFGDTPALVIAYATAYLDGLGSGGVAGCLKHFPGLGAATVDPHKALPTVNRTLDQMQATELVPYRQMALTNHIPMIMTTHMLIPSLDPNLPTSISPAVLTTLLREQMGYDGVIVSDALYMGGLSYRWDIPHAGLRAFEAGTDLLLGQENADQSRQTIQLLRDALGRGEITQARIDASVLRILKFKFQWKIITASFLLPA